VKEIFRLIAVLTVVAIVAGFMLAVTERVTRKPIADAQRRALLESLGKVLPPHDNSPDAETIAIEDRGRTWTVYVARGEGRFAGAAFRTSTDKGYSGLIDVLVGVTAGDTVHGIAILAQTETPGLGAKIAEPAFIARFQGRPLAGTRWAVVPDGGEIDSISGATISPRAVVEAVKEGLDMFTRNRDAIERAQPPN
jgi:Na+-translocating ferredoxin:NAD+ oxidoreductase subunit G